jgi:hypothetical protein
VSSVSDPSRRWPRNRLSTPFLPIEFLTFFPVERRNWLVSYIEKPAFIAETDYPGLNRKQTQVNLTGI